MDNEQRARLIAALNALDRHADDTKQKRRWHGEWQQLLAQAMACIPKPAEEATPAKKPAAT